MESLAIVDIKITGSSVLDVGTPAKNGRLNYIYGPSWCASTSDSNPYLQIDLQTLHIICAVSTQGNSQSDDWVKTFTLQLSTDGTRWTDYKENKQVKVNSSLLVLVHILLSSKTEGELSRSYKTGLLRAFMRRPIWCSVLKHKTRLHS